jgi:hypothetical protein
MAPRRTSRLVCTSCLVLAGWLLVGRARAGEGEGKPPPDRPTATPPKRQPPDYDGRGGPKEPPARKLLWLPRVLLFPAYVVSEYVVRRPLELAISSAERAGLPAAVYDFLGLGTSHPMGVVPFALLDFGFEPSVGLYAYWDNAGFKGHDLRLRGSTWGPRWLSATATERFRFGEQLELTLSATATRRPDYTFYGIGPDTREAELVRYSGDSFAARFQSWVGFYGRSSLQVAAGYRGARYGHTEYDAEDRGDADYEPSLDEAVAAGELPEPDGFRSGFRAPYGMAHLILDSRGRSRRKTGLRLDASVEQSTNLDGAPASGWLRYGGTLWAFADLRDGGRMLSLAVTTQLVEPLGDGPIPFTQLVSLGGGRSMAGFRSGRLYDRSSAVVTLRYSWPIWLSLNGSIQAGLGNVFGARFAGLRPGRARLSTAIGLETYGSRDVVFQALVGFGSETFERGADLESVRLVLGVRSGF